MSSKNLTPEDLEKLVACADAEGIAKAAESLTESERRKLSKTASELYKRLNQARFLAFVTNSREEGILKRLKRLFASQEPPDARQQCNAAQIAALAFCPLSTVRGIDGRLWGTQQEASLIKVLQDRKPDWLEQWIEGKLEGESRGIEWNVLRRLIREGTCAKPTCEGYARLMAACLPDNLHRVSEGSYRPLSAKLREDRELLEDEVWRLFTTETEAFTNDYFVDKAYCPEGYETWLTAFCKLAESGDLDRQRLIDACLDGLFMGFKNNILSGFIKLHESLEPTLEELSSRQQNYLDLLSSAPTHVVTFALKTLKAIDKCGRLDDDGFLAAAGGAMGSRTQSHAKAAITLLEKIVKRDPKKAPSAALTLIDALTHESPDIQQRAMDLVEPWADPQDDQLAQALSERLDDVAASQRPRLESLLNSLVGEPLSYPEESRNATAPEAASREELVRRAESLPRELRVRSGIEDALAALDTGLFPPLRFDVLHAAVLTGVGPVTPINDVDELIEAVAHAVETVDSADEVERILDGISRLCDQRPEDFERKTAPLVKRIDEFTKSEIPVNLHGLVAYNIPGGMAGVLLAWLRPHQAFPGFGNAGEELTSQFLQARLVEIGHRARKGQPSPLLAAPTHAHGWIDPRTLVDRIKNIDGFHLEKYRYDLLQALIRLAPDHRPEALADASTLEVDVGRIVRWALGGPDGPTGKDKKPNAAFWLAAGRARSPHLRLDELAECGFDDPGPNGIERARYTWHGIPADDKEAPRFVRRRDTRYLSCSPELKKMPSPTDWPTVALHDPKAWYDSAAWLRDWRGTLWPQNPDSYFATGVRVLASRMDDNASTWNPAYVFLKHLLPPDRRWTTVARLLALLGLAGRDADVRNMALEALAEGVADGRAHPEELGETFAVVTGEPPVKLNRLVAALSEVARISDTHTFVVAGLLTVWLKRQEELPRDAHLVLELLLELLTQCGIPLDDEARKPLENLKGASKTAKLAKRLLELAPPEPEAKREKFLLKLLEGRIARAERWQSA